MRSRRPLATGTVVLAFFASASHVAAASSFTRGYGPCTITAAVRDTNGRPVAGAIVDASGPAVRSATTSAAGIVSFVALPPGRYALRARSIRAESGVQGVTATALAPGLGNATRAFPFVALQLEPDGVGASLAERDAVVVPLSLADAAPGFALATEPHVEMGGLGRSGTLRIDGGDPRSLRERLDGIPLPDALRGSLALVGAPALGAAVAFAGGTGLLGARPEPGTGGVLDLTTEPLRSASTVDAGVGASGAGTAGSLAADLRAGPFGAGFRLEATGGSRAGAIDARVRLSPTTQIDAETYRLDDGDGLAAGAYAVDVRSATLSTTAGPSRIALQLYDSGFALGAASVADRLHGIALHYDGTFGPTGLDVAYVRDAEDARYAFGERAGATSSRLGVRSVYDLSSAVRAEVQSSTAGGALTGDRTDVATTVGVTLSPAWRLAVTAASGTSTAPLDLVAREPLAVVRAPATARETSVSLSDVAGARRLTFEGFATRERDRFAAIADANATGLSVAYAGEPASGVGFDLSAALARVVPFGAATPQRDPATTALANVLGSDANDDLAALRGRFALTYGARSGTSLSLGATYLDAPNELAPTALVLGDVSVRVPLQRGPGALAVRLRANDVLGGPLGGVSGALRGPLDVRRFLELTLERKGIS